MVYRTATTPSTLIGLLLVAWCWTLGSLLLARAVSWPVSFPAYLAYVSGAVLAALGFGFVYWVYASLTMRYELKNDSLLIQLGPVQQSIPLNEVLRIVPGYTLPAPQVNGVNTWGLHIGKANLGPEGGQALVYSTHHRPEQLLYIVTMKRTYAISPEQPSRFTRALQTALPAGGEHRTAAALAPVPMSSPRLTWFDVMAHPFWWDRKGQLLVIGGLALNLLFYGFLFAIFPGLPDNLDLAFPPGLAERVGSKNEILELPLVALVVFAASTVVALLLHARERAAAYLLLMAAVGTQVLLWGASLASIV
jgi:hypothetical protein